MLDLLARLSTVDRLQLLAFDAELCQLQRPLIEALWAGVEVLKVLRAPGTCGFAIGYAERLLSFA